MLDWNERKKGERETGSSETLDDSNVKSFINIKQRKWMYCSRVMLAGVLKIYTFCSPNEIFINVFRKMNYQSFVRGR